MGTTSRPISIYYSSTWILGQGLEHSDPTAKNPQGTKRQAQPIALQPVLSVDVPSIGALIIKMVWGGYIML